MPIFADQQWLLIALVFFGVMGYVVWIRWRDRLWIDRRYGLSEARVMSFGVNYYGLASQPSVRRPSSGFLLMLPDRLVYRSRIAKQLVEIPGEQIFHITHGTSHGGVALHQSVVIIAFTDRDGAKDAVAFKVPYPPQWIAAIQANFIGARETQNHHSA
jgi:hypothetical protein